MHFHNYSWPGNVRELRNTLERAVIVCDGAVIETKHLPPGFGQTTPAHVSGRSGRGAPGGRDHGGGSGEAADPEDARSHQQQ